MPFGELGPILDPPSMAVPESFEEYKELIRTLAHDLATQRELQRQTWFQDLYSSSYSEAWHLELKFSG